MTAPDGVDAQSADRDALLELLLDEEGLDITRSRIGRRDRALPPVLSAAQERMWFLDQFESDSSSLAISAALVLRGPLDVEALRASLDTIYRRHDVLRTVFTTVAGEPRPTVLPSESVPFRVVGAANRGDLEEAVSAETALNFDLQKDPPIRVTLMRLADDHHVLLVVMHHVASDGTSLGVFLRELQVLYGANLSGTSAELPALSLQYEDYASWQRHEATTLFEPQLDFWRQQLGDRLPAFEIPPDFQRPARHTFDGGKVTARLSPELSRELSSLSGSVGATLFMTMLAGFEVVVCRHAGQDEAVIGTPIAGRVRPEFEPMIGAFLNTLVLRTDLGDNPTVKSLIERVRDVSLAAFDNQDVPFELVLNDLQPPRDISRTPLFQIFFNMTHYDVAETIALPGLRCEVFELPDQDSKFDLTMYVNDGADGTDLALVYNRKLFSHAHMQHLMEQYVHVLGAMTAAPDARVDELSLVTDTDRAIVPDLSGALDATWHGSVPAAVRRIADHSPERVAVVDPSRQWTYAALAAQMDDLGGWLRSLGVGVGHIVAITGHRSGGLVPAVMGVLASGAAYVLLDGAYPPARIAQLLRIAKPSAWIHLTAAGTPAPDVIDALDDLGVAHRLILAESAEMPAHESSDADFDDAVVDDIGADDPACVTFTSGSTGVPKAVVGRHGSLTHFLPWMSEEFGVGDNDRFSMLSGLSHDPLQRDMFWPLWLGATITVPDPDEMNSPGYLAGWLRNEGVTVAHLTPAMGQLVGERGVRSPDVDSLRLAFFIGDVLTREQVMRFSAVAPNVRVVNLYGTTETQRSSGYHLIDREPPVPDGTQAREILPLGVGMRGTELFVRTAAGSPAAVGEVGGIALRGSHLAIGYLDDPEMTAARFYPDPAGTNGCARVYVTGDCGRYRADGVVEFMGRTDDQVQLRGFRIELGEVAAALRSQPGVVDAAADLRMVEPIGQRLVAYVVAETKGSIDGRELLGSLRATLPGHMVPHEVIELDAIPMTANGKTDRRALPDPVVSVSEESTGPSDSLERMLVDIWETVLGRQPVGVDDDFFDLGGYSLLATRLFALLEERTGHRLPVSVLFVHPTIAGLAHALRDDGWSASWSSLVPIQPAGSGQPFYYVAPYMISVLELAPLGQELGRDRPLYGLQPHGLDGSAPPHTGIEAMATHYISELKSVQPKGPYALGGHCAGSWVAFEMARQLEQRGDEINALILVDQGPPGVERPKINFTRFVVGRVKFYSRSRRLRHVMAWNTKILLDRVLLRRVGAPVVRVQEHVNRAHRLAYRNYRGGRISTDIVLILSADSLELIDKRWYGHWSELTDGVLNTRGVGSTHANLLVRPDVADLASEIALRLDPPQ